MFDELLDGELAGAHKARRGIPWHASMPLHETLQRVQRILGQRPSSAAICGAMPLAATPALFTNPLAFGEKV